MQGQPLLRLQPMQPVILELKQRERLPIRMKRVIRRQVNGSQAAIFPSKKKWQDLYSPAMVRIQNMLNIVKMMEPVQDRHGHGILQIWMPMERLRHVPKICP